MSCPEKFCHNRKHTHTQPARGQWTSSHSVPTRVIQQAAEVCEVPSGLPRCSCPSFSPFQRAVCAVVPIWAWSKFRDSTLPVELWGTKVCCNVFTLPVGSFVLLSLNDQFPYFMDGWHHSAAWYASCALSSIADSLPHFAKFAVWFGEIRTYKTWVWHVRKQQLNENHLIGHKHICPSFLLVKQNSRIRCQCGFSNFSFSPHLDKVTFYKVWLAAESRSQCFPLYWDSRTICTVWKMHKFEIPDFAQLQI